MSLRSLSHLIDSAAGHLAAPFQTWGRVVDAVLAPVNEITELSGKSGWLYVLSSIAIAWCVFVIRRNRGKCSNSRSFFAYLFPREIYTHRSAMTDYKFVAVDLSTKSLLYVPLITGMSWAVYKFCLYLLSGSSSVPATPAATLLTCIVAVLVTDLGFYVAHYLMHKVPVLWEFHKVHHSAEVLTPLTVYRIHPVEGLVSAVVAAVLSAIITVLYGTVSDNDPKYLTIFGINLITFGFYFSGNLLRHSHIWISYGPVLSRLFISPAQHQIHHSLDPKHIDKNFGYIFAIWDALFGSLYVPRCRESLRYGLADTPAGQYDSVIALYFLPFSQTLQRLRSAGMAANVGNPSTSIQKSSGSVR